MYVDYTYRTISEIAVPYKAGNQFRIIGQMSAILYLQTIIVSVAFHYQQ